MKCPLLLVMIGSMQRILLIIGLLACVLSSAWGQQLERYKRKQFLTVSELRLAQKEAQERKDSTAQSEIDETLSLIAERAPFLTREILTSTVPSEMRQKEAFWIQEIAPIYNARVTKEMRSMVDQPGSLESMIRQREELKVRLRAIYAEVDAHMANYFTAEENAYYQERRKRQREADQLESQKRLDAKRSRPKPARSFSPSPPPP